MSDAPAFGAYTEISADGMTITVTFNRTNAQGQPVTTVAVYEKMP